VKDEKVRKYRFVIELEGFGEKGDNDDLGARIADILSVRLHKEVTVKAWGESE
jgi:hypothetical protein